ncbi:cysteine hydrolase family protein [Acinetobacter guerrae]|uniref:cysteine hydrolase family protein n=1 Tax=Acinetobacter guerrae TaxID=1843371 RepID=UPI00128C3325|nr:cysteine hydrolase family protein [Acinetobacter guerrae]MPW45518.1 isochorismatase [Acinetobacter guerrae]
MKKALLVIDVQNDYFEGGAMPLALPELALAHINQLEALFLAENLPIIYVQHINTPEALFFRPETHGVALHPQLQVRDDSIVIEKTLPNSFLKTSLGYTLQHLHIEQLVITGMMTHMCIDSTTRAAAECGYQPILIADATATRDLKFCDQITCAADVQIAFLAALATFAKVKNTHEFIQV